MSVVGLTLVNDDSVYINPSQVTCLKKGEGPDGDSITQILLGASERLVVKGDIDNIAFQLFPNGVR
ncbi:MAG TPA: hypothetical protein VM689_21050 [Aliidongia sp.]|nr:hypothetical protein [Aliidongia sp.]